MPIKIVEARITREELAEIAKERFGDLVKAVVDVEKGVMAIGAEMHADEEEVLLERGSAQKDLWGVNLYPAELGDAFIEFDSMINIRPSQGNRSRGVEDPEIRKRIRKTVAKLVIE